ncbi:MAG TPA: hypothetical protein VN914_15195, partial [Polyangia bacterium]|nr:hypothetical protein [Polyangia bacterium]
DVLIRTTPIQGILPTLPKVRRAMANVATYMIVDDHEITDDLNLSQKWKKQVYAFGSPGRAVVRNGLVAYAFFQGWGNDPPAFSPGGANAGFIALAASAITARDAQSVADLDDKLGISGLFDSKVVWHFRWLEPAAKFGLFVLDSRTRRAFRGETTPPTLIAPLAMDLQLPKNDVSKATNPNREVLFVVAPAPVLGVPVIEDIFQVGQAVFDSQAVADQEAWSGDPACLEQLLARLAPARRVVLLSGDVHFGHGTALSYWIGAEATPARFAQFTSSALKNSASDWQEDLVRSLGVSQRILRIGGGRARLGWNNPSPAPLTFPASNPLLSFALPVRARFRRTPVLLPAAEWPAGVAFARQPDFTWRLTLARDVRADKDRPADRPATPPDIPPGTVTVTKLLEVANHHSAAMKTRSIARQLVFRHNLGVVTVRPSAAGRLVAQHTMLSPPTDAPGSFAEVTVHEVELDPDPGNPEKKPGLQP